MSVKVSPEDRRRMAIAARSLATVETTAKAGGPAAAAAIAAANADRRRQGRPLLTVAPDLPEEGFYRRARALGFRRSRG
jgi:hypothetical protein